MVCKITSTKGRLRRAASGASLIESLMAVGVTALLMLALGSISLFSGRTFAAFYNYVDLDDHNRIGMDIMTRDLRECNRVTGCTGSRLDIEDFDGLTITYVFDIGARTLTRTKTGGVPKQLLSGCDSLTFSIA